MGKAYLINASRVLLALGTIASLLSVAGGGIVLPPFKTLPWLKTSTSIVGLYGSCSRAGLNVDSFFSYSKDWKSSQGEKCRNIFTGAAAPATDPVGRLTPRDEIMLTGIQGLSILVAFAALVTYRVKSPSTGTLFTVGAFVLQAVSFSLGTLYFRTIWADLVAGQYQGNVIQADKGVSLSYGLYLAGGAAVLQFTAALIAYVAGKKEKETFSTWDV